MTTTNAMLFSLLVFACCVAAFFAVVLAEQRLATYRMRTNPTDRANTLRAYIEHADAETLCVMADAIADRAKAVIAGGSEPDAFYILSWLHSGLRPAQSVMRGFLRQRADRRANPNARA